MRYVDLFAGIGGFRLGLDKVGGFECVYSNEWDKYASEIYKKHYGEIDTRDITKVEAKNIPDHDLLTAGFPCQAFSIAGKRRGFEDTRGTLFFEIARIAKEKRPRYLLLENVKGLLSHDKGETFSTILGVLSDLGYRVEWQVLNSKHFGVPQNRERVFIVGHLRGESRGQVFPIGGIDSNSLEEITRNVSDAQRVYKTSGVAKNLKGLGGGMGAKTGLYAVHPVLTPDGKIKKTSNESLNIDKNYHKGLDNHGQRTGVMQAMQWRRTEKGKQARRESQKKGRDYTPFSDGHRELVPKKGKPIGTLTSQAVSKDSLIGNEFLIRRLTPVECERLQGFPDGWTKYGVVDSNPGIDETPMKVVISDTQRYKCLGNAVTTNVVEAIGKKIAR